MYALPSLHEIELEEERRRLKRSLAAYSREAWKIVEPSTALIWNWHLDAIGEHLQAVSEGQIQQLLINIPPGHQKSLQTCVFWPTWVWGPFEKPEWRAVFSSYASQLAIRDSVKCRLIIESDWYQRRFVKGRWALADDQNLKSYYENTRRGFRLATSVDGQGTGHRGDAIVVDDPLKAGDAFSKAARDEVIRWWDQEMRNRVSDARTGVRVIIMQRLHQEDLAGHVLAKGGWEHLCLPSEFEPKRCFITFAKPKPERPTIAPAPASGGGSERSSGDHASEKVPESLGDSSPPAQGAGAKVGQGTRSVARVEFWRDPRTEEGELLFPTMFPREVIEEEKLGLGTLGYAGQHQQRPTAAEGAMFKGSWWRFWRYAWEDDVKNHPLLGDLAARTIVLPEKFDEKALSWDCTFKDTKKSDFVAGGVWGRLGALKFLLELVWKRMDFPTTLKAFKQQAEDHPDAQAKLVEDKANGPAIISTLRTEIAGIIEVNPEGGKEARAAATSPQVEAGNVYLPLHAEWRDRYIEEHTNFPLGAYDDVVDQQSQMLLRWTPKKKSNLEHLRAMAKR